MQRQATVVIFRLFFFLCVIGLTPASLADAKLSADLFYKEGQQKYKAGQYFMAAMHFKTSILLEENNSNRLSSQFGYALSMNKLGETDEALSSIKLIDESGNSAYLEKTALFKKMNWDMTSHHLTSEHKKRIEAWENRNLIPENYKSPALAGTLSAVFPGAGQAYVGTWASGLYSFVLNSLFLSAAVELNQKELRATSAAAWVVFSMTYVGGIISATESAKIHNQNQIRNEESALYENLFPELKP
jgi:hypothetical protein